ncbi:hypothetical protein ACFX5K_03245 [Rickettsiales bacterium LUAb2]
MDYKLKYKIRTVDFYLIIVFLLFSSVSHFTASKIIVFPSVNIPLISATFTYMFPMSLTDLVRAYSTQKNAFKFIIIEMIFVFLIIAIPHSFFLLNSPTWATIPNLNIAFHLALSMYKANFIGIFIDMILDIIIFSFLFNNVFHKLNLYKRFLLADIISSFLVIGIYSYITNYQFFYRVFPNHWSEITNYSILSNFTMIVIYSFICSIILKFINLYMEKK